MCRDKSLYSRWSTLIYLVSCIPDYLSPILSLHISSANCIQGFRMTAYGCDAFPIVILRRP
jgi:hypothetical protein